MRLLLLLTLLAAFPAISTDMYLPAIPTIQTQWGITLAQANLSLVVYFAVFSAMLLVHGPLSDRFGRRPVLIGGILLFIAGSLWCAWADSISLLIAARVVQATGAAAAAALSLALAKDLYEGLERQKILAYIGVILPLCPMLAPMLGSLMLEALSWRWIFVSQAILALIALVGVLRLREPDIERTMGGVVSVVRRYIVLLKNPRYMSYTAAFCLMPAGFYAFVAGSGNIYITGFGMSEQIFGLFFGFNALCLMAGSFLCSRLTVGLSAHSLLLASLAGLMVGGVVMLLSAGATPMWFMSAMGLISFFLGLSRPISNNLILEQVEQDVGAASAMLTFSFFLVGAVAMEAISMDVGSKAMFIGWLALAGSVIPFPVMLLARGKEVRAKAQAPAGTTDA